MAKRYAPDMSRYRSIGVTIRSRAARMQARSPDGSELTGVPAKMRGRWRAAVAAAGMAAGLVPYCLRHSSIVRGLRAGLPVRLAVAVHDTSADRLNAAKRPSLSMPATMICAEPLCQWLQRMLPARKSATS
jgi:hypothetical protein